MLSVSVIGAGGEQKFHSYALNEAVLSGMDILRLVNLDVYVNDICMNSLSCDGVIVATPTGSTAYSLSAGGPAVLPELDIMLVTNVCPHSLSSCKVVVSGSEVVRLCPEDSSKACALTVDGQTDVKLDRQDSVLVRRAKNNARFIRFSDKKPQTSAYGLRYAA